LVTGGSARPLTPQQVEESRARYNLPTPEVYRAIQRFNREETRIAREIVARDRIKERETGLPISTHPSVWARERGLKPPNE